MARKIIKGFGFFLITWLCVVSLQAKEYRRLGQDFRSLAMGNTGIASANNSAALFYNPAAMANIFNWWVDLPFIQITYSDDTKSLYDYATNIEEFSLETQAEREAFMDEFIGLNPYIKLDVGANFFANLTNKGLTLGANYTYEAVLDIEVANPNLPEIKMFGRLDNVRQAGISVPLGLGKWVLGVSVKTIERTEIDFSYGTSALINEDPFPNLVEDGVKGIGTGYDVGFLYRSATAARIIVGGVWRQEILLGDATKIPEEVALGIATTHEFGIFRLTMAMDMRDITTKWGSEDDKSYNRRLHYGAEFGIFPQSKSSSWLTLRTGYNQGYIATGYMGLTGVEVSLGRGLVLGITKYIEETGEFAGQKPSPRTILYLAFGF